MLLDDKATLSELHDHIAVLSDAKDLLGVNDERKKLVARWLFIFGYSDRETLLTLTNATGSTGYRFIADLIKRGYVQKFKNSFYGKDLLMLGKPGLGVLLEDRAINTDQARLPNKRKFIDSSRVHHEVGLHKALLAYLMTQDDSFDLVDIKKEVRYEPLMIDVVLHLRDIQTDIEVKTAFEFERTEKSRQRIEYMLVEHMKNIQKHHYYTTIFCFDDKVLHDYYLKIMLAQPREWSKNKKGQLHSARAYNSTKFMKDPLSFMLVNEADPKMIDLENIKQDKTHRLHSYLADMQQKEKDDREAAEEAEHERREQIEGELRPIIEKEILDKQTPIIEAKIREEIRLEEEARQKQLKDEKFFNQMRGLFKKE